MITRYFLREINRACCTGCMDIFSRIGGEPENCPGPDSCNVLIQARADAIRNTREVNGQVY